jgi:hypothetical protein
LDRKYVLTRQGKDMILYAGLLNEAHQHGLTSILTELVQIPSPANGNVAICRAVVVTDRGTFSGFGEVNATDKTTETNPVARANPIRMAETRAKGRALRDAINLDGAVADDVDEAFAPERGETPDAEAPSSPKTAQSAPVTPFRVPVGVSAQNGPSPANSTARRVEPQPEPAAPMTEGQARALADLLRRTGEERDLAGYSFGDAAIAIEALQTKLRGQRS